MALVGAWANLAEAQLLTRSDFVSGVVAEVIKEGGVLGDLPIREISGNDLRYNRENIIPVGAFHSIADAWTSTEDIDHTQITTTLAIHGDQKNIDDFVKRTYDNENDMLAVVKQQTAKGLKITLETKLIYEATQFSGWHSLVTTGQTKNQGTGATGAALSAAKLDAAIDLNRGGAINLLYMPRQIALRLDQIGRGGSTSYPVIQIQQTSDGKAGISLSPRVEVWNGIEVRRSDFMGIVETIASGAYSAQTGGATGTIFIFRFGQPEEGGAFLAVGNSLFEEVGPYPDKDSNSEWLRIRSYIAPGIGSSKCLSAVDGITDAAVVV